MTFGQKLKKLRSENNLTQEQLADMIFVTRSAVSKWETDSGYPGIDSFKAISGLFGVSIDELISDDDIKNKKLLDDKKARKFYFAAMAFLCLSATFALLAYFLKNRYLSAVGVCGIIGYAVFALLSKPGYRRLRERKKTAAYVVSRCAIFIIISAVAIYTLIAA